MTDEKIVEGLLLFCDALDNSVMTLRRELKNLSKLQTEKASIRKLVPETVFSDLKWRSENGTKLGFYEIALIQDNESKEWKKAYSILKNRESTISHRFHEESYEYCYWLYDKMDYKIFSQKLRDPFL